MPEWVNNNMVFIYVLSGVIVLLAALILVQHKRLRVANKQIKRYQVLLKDNNGDNLEAIILKMRSELNKKGKDLEALGSRLENVEAKMPELVQNIGVIRFKGFEDVGGDLSFSTAILTGKGDGVVLTALHARDDTRIYAKRVEKYVSSYPLSEEEISAIKQSQKKVN